VAADTTGGAVLLNGTPTSGDLLQWSSTGVQDSGVAAANVVTAGSSPSFATVTVTNSIVSPASSNIVLTPGTAGGVQLGAGGSPNVWSVNSAGQFVPTATNTQNIGSSSQFVSSVYAKNVTIEGGSSGNDTLASLNASSSARTISIPAGTANDTLAMIGVAQTFSAANIFSGAVAHSGTTLFSGAGASLTANGQTSIMGGTTAPTPGSTYAGVFIGGNYASPPILPVAGQGNIFANATNGLALQGKNTGDTADVSVYGGNGTLIATFSTGVYGTQIVRQTNYNNNHIWDSITNPSAFVGATAGSLNGTPAFTFTPTNGVSTGSFTMPSSSGWMCQFTDLTTPTQVVQQTGAISATSVSYTAFARTTGTASNFGTGDTVTAMCKSI
jgi:hypothetical protein